MSRHLHLHLHFTPIYLPPTLLHTELWSDHAESSRSLSLTGLMTERRSNTTILFSAWLIQGNLRLFVFFRLRRAGTGLSRRSLTPLRRARQGLPKPTDQSHWSTSWQQTPFNLRGRVTGGEGALPFGTHTTSIRVHFTNSSLMRT